MDRLRDFFLKRTRVTDASRAAVANKVKANRVEICLKLSRFEIGRNNLRARREGCLDPRLAIKAKRGCVLEGEIDTIEALSSGVGLLVPDRFKCSFQNVLIDILYRRNSK